MKLKNTPSVFLLFLLLNLTANAQQILHFKHACSFDGDREDAEIYADDASDEATKIVRNIMKINVLPQNFIIKSGNVKNALASVEGKQRYILYSTSFLESFKADENAKWAAYCLMAHEIGHHLSNHDMEETDPSRCRLREIQADKFAGGILFRMGATLLQAQAGINNYTSEVGSRTHPPKSARLEAVASGWKQMQENMRAGGFEQPKPTVQNEAKPSFTEVSDNLLTRKLVGTWDTTLKDDENGKERKATFTYFADGKFILIDVENEELKGTWSIKAGIFILIVDDSNLTEEKFNVKFINSNQCELIYLEGNDKSERTILKLKRKT